MHRHLRPAAHPHRQRHRGQGVWVCLGWAIKISAAEAVVYTTTATSSPSSPWCWVGGCARSNARRDQLRLAMPPPPSGQLARNRTCRDPRPASRATALQRQPVPHAPPLLLLCTPRGTRTVSTTHALDSQPSTHSFTAGAPYSSEMNYRLLKSYSRGRVASTHRAQMMPRNHVARAHIGDRWAPHNELV